MAMYRISDGQISELQGEIAKRDDKIERLTMKQRARRAANQATLIGEIVGTGVLIGAARGKCEQKWGKFTVPGLDFDAELALGVFILGSGLVMAQSGQTAVSRWADDALIVGSTILAGFGRSVAKSWVKTGTFSLTNVGALPGWMGEGDSSPWVSGAPQAALVDALASQL